jgi:hypothetical protein
VEALNNRLARSSEGSEHVAVRHDDGIFRHNVLDLIIEESVRLRRVCSAEKKTFFVRNICDVFAVILKPEPVLQPEK